MGNNAKNRIELPCKFGTLVCEVTRADEDYREFSIDLVRNDGHEVQIACIGTNENDEGLSLFSDEELRQYRDMVHVYLWNGESQDCCGEHYVAPFGDGYYC